MPRSYRHIPMYGFGAMQKAGGAGAIGKPELFQMANWAATAAYEADAVTGITEAVVTATRTKETTIVSGTVYALKCVFAGTGAAFVIDLEDAAINLQSGTNYTITIVARHTGVGSNVRVGLTSTSNGSNNEGGDLASPASTPVLTSATTTYTTYSLAFTHNGSTRYLASREFSGSDDGGLYISSISIK